MNCNNCGEREATIHEVRLTKGGGKIELHLCQQCAAQAGIEVGPQTKSVHAKVPGLVSASVMLGGAGGSGPATAQCPECGFTYEQFRKIELLGCASCYEAFVEQLGPLLERTHEGATHHVGKTPRMKLERSRLKGEGGDVEALIGAEEERKAKLEVLRKQLEDAVRGEQYERAARLRDEIARIREIG